ncbi:hypothetical protein I4U23_004992 [Adineta vaga]|nr:hypothetical protein I4U23_004992 [Adineta vaga]
MSLSRDDLRLRALQNGSEQRVEVNQRMLIDKMLARYSSNFAVCRELIQNSDDAHATFFHFEITCDMPIAVPNKARDFHNSTITEIRSINNGLVFNEIDWKRVASIAEGNNNVDSVGQFGVGFFSVFSFSEEPIITSGNEYMTFVWRDDNSLTTFRHKLPVEQQSKLTSIILKMRTKYILHTDEITNINERDIKSTKKTKNKIVMKENVPTIDLRQLQIYFTKVLSFTKYINELIIKINGFTVFEIHKTTTNMPSISGILPFQKQSSINNMLLLKSFVQTEKTFTITNNSAITLNHITVDAQVTIDEEFHNHIRRIIKKSLPPNIQIQFLFASSSLIASQQEEISSINDNHHTNMLSTLIPLKFENDNIIPSGHIFIGLGTHQTTGIGMHIYSHLIPTIERENIDLQDAYIAKWNKEILASAGQIARLIYDQEMLINSKKTQEIINKYSLIIAPYSFQPSVPNNQIGQVIIDGFFASNKDILVPVQTKPSEYILSILPSTKAFLPDSKQVYGFLTLPLVPFQLKSNGLITNLVQRQLIDCVDKSMIEKILLSSILSIPEFIELVNWLFSNDVTDKVYAKRVLSNVRFHDHNHASEISFKQINYYDVLDIPSSLPFPLNTIPKEISTILSQEQLEKQLCLLPLKLKNLLNFLLDDKQLRQLSISKTYPYLLSLISTHSGQLIESEWNSIIKTLSKTECIPTTQGMKLPCESFVLSASISPQLPCIVLNILQSNTDNNGNEDKQLNENCENPVSIYFLKKIGCRMLDFNGPDDDDDNPSVSSSSDTMEMFIRRLVKERKNMSQADFNELKEKPSLKGKTLVPTKETTRKYIPRDLHFPSAAIQMQWSTLLIIDWLDINPSSSEYAFLKELGVKEVPSLRILIEQIIEEHNIEKQNQNTQGKYKIPLALTFFAENFEQYYYNSWKLDTIRQYRFLPSYLPENNNDNDVVLLAPDEVYKSVNPLCPSLLPEVLILFQKNFINSSLDIGEHPSLSKAFDTLLGKSTNFLTKQSAPKIFAYLNRLQGIDQTFIKKVSNSNFIPIQDLSNNTILTKPSQVFIRSNADTSSKTDTDEITDIDTSGLIDYVDFGVDANAFLLTIGVVNHPKSSALAELMIDRQARYFASAEGNKDMLNKKMRVYINCLKELIVAYTCSNELQQEPLYTRLKTSAWCLGFRNIDHENGTREQIFEIVKPDEIYLDDSPMCAEKFRPLLPPKISQLPTLYQHFGAKWLSDCVTKTRTCIGKPVTSVKTNELRALIQYRFPMLFVNNREERLEGCIEEHIKLLRTTLSIYEVDHIKSVLTFKNQTIQLDSENASWCMLVYDTKNVMLYLRKDITNIDYYDIAAEIHAFCFIREVNYVHDISDKLGLSIEILRRRGIPVDRLLQSTHTEELFSVHGMGRQLPPPPPQQQQQQKQQPRQKSTFLQNLRSWLPFGRKGKNSSISPDVNNHQPKAGPTTAAHNGRKATDQNHQISPIIGVGGDYTTHTHSFHKPTPMPDFGRNKKESQNYMKKIRKSQAYNHSKLIRLPYTKTEINTICEQIPSENMTRFDMVFHSIPLYVEENVIITNAMIDQGYQLAYLLKGLATRVFNMAYETIHLFRDINGTKIAFNYGGSLFFNLRYFEQVYADELKPYLRISSPSTPIIHTIVNFYFMVTCHELAHNIVHAHDEDFVKWLEEIAVKFMTDKDLFLEQFSFINYEP